MDAFWSMMTMMKMIAIKFFLTKMCPRIDVIELEISVALENGVNGTFINLP